MIVVINDVPEINKFAEHRLLPSYRRISLNRDHHYMIIDIIKIGESCITTHSVHVGCVQADSNNFL